MLDIRSLPLQADQARAARNYYGMSQAKAAEESALPLHKLKRFEAGNYLPDTEFLEELREFYEERGFTFDDTPQPGANAKSAGKVFPAGVVGGEHGDSPRSPVKTTVQHMRIAMTDDAEIGRVLELIDENEQKVEDLLIQPIEKGFLRGLSDKSEAVHGEVLKLLAENGAQFARLFGRDIGGSPKPEVLAGKTEPAVHADLLHERQSDAHLAVAGQRDAKARRQGRPKATTLTQALFG